MSDKPFEILLVEDNPADVRLAREAFKTSKIQSVLTVVKDGVEAMDFLRQRTGYIGAARPDLIFLDLNLPRKDGREVLAEIKADKKPEANSGDYFHNLSRRAGYRGELRSQRQLLHCQAGRH